MKYRGIFENAVVGSSKRRWTGATSSRTRRSRACATRLLERLGYRVIAAANGRDAVDVLTQEGEAIHLAILDVVMLEMPGPAVVEHVRPRYPRLRFLLTTGYSPGTLHMTPVQDLPASVLPKPYGLRELARAVRRALDAERQGRG